MPRGSMRAIITLSLIVGTVVLAIWGDDGTFAAFIGLSGIAVRDYFAHRAEQDAQNGPPLPPPA